jgi:predicted nucleic acid-binding protein
MEWIKKLHGSTVGLDTAPLIYFIERHPTYLRLVYPFFESVERGEIQIVTSMLTLTEVLVHPFKHGDQGLADLYSDMLLNTSHLIALPVSAKIAEEAARIRAAYGVKTPDSIQLATARIGNATAFLTNDRGFAPIPGLEVIVLEQVLAGP